ncbi:hypothetical protein RBSWK_01030 [Rhodopirellula baltica SWK14]|uniref:Uncharacterized protein n=1 Tax=Rhodopirellula baltica SWK14 TaxID=993516 RepID=L7CMI2_RHOBT|nr:hypothetical protein RBSWK_01030 [Rhodopirellula baltica SWK14]
MKRSFKKVGKARCEQRQNNPLLKKDECRTPLSRSRRSLLLYPHFCDAMATPDPLDDAKERQVALVHPSYTIEYKHGKMP